MSSFKRIRMIYPYFKKPVDVSELLEFEGQLWMVVAIEDVIYSTVNIQVDYVCQSANVSTLKREKHDVRAALQKKEDSVLYPAYYVFHIKHARAATRSFRVGKMVEMHDVAYRIMEIRGISFVETNVRVDLLVQPIAVKTEAEMRKAKLDWRKNHAQKLQWEEFVT